MHRSTIRPLQYVKYDRFALFTAAKLSKVRYIKQNQERTLQNSINTGDIPLGTRNTNVAKYFQLMQIQIGSQAEKD